MSDTPMHDYRREIILFSIAIAAILVILVGFGEAYTIRMLVEIACHAVLALGLTIQWGYAGVFNAGVMGFMAVGAFVTMLFSFSINDSFWNSEGPEALGGLFIQMLILAVAIAALTQLHRLGVSQRIKTASLLTALIIAFFVFNNAVEPVAKIIESQAGFIGGFGMPVIVGWIAGGVAAALVAYGIGKACLGLRSDYLAIATLGFAEIIKAILKNADWLTRGTLTVSPLPWPVPTPNDIGFVFARSAYLSLMAVIVIAMFLLLQRAYRAPWGRMMRAIRDNEIAAAAMGKDVNFRRLEIFVLGSGLIGIGGAALITFARIFDPAGFHPLKNTFVIWVMVLVGGAGSNLGAIFGATAIYIIWIMSEPMTLFVFDLVANYGRQWFDWEPPADFAARALQTRVFLIGLTITLALRYVPDGLIPEEALRTKNP